MKIAAIVGSIRKESYNRQLALCAKEIIMRSGGNFEILEYSDVPFFSQDSEVPAPDSVTRVRKQIQEADGIWFFTPEYNHFFPGVLKNLLDWLSRPVENIDGSVLAGKPAAISGITLGMAGTALAQDHLVTLLSFINTGIMNAPRLTIPNAESPLGGNGGLKLRASYPYLEKQANDFLEFIGQRKNSLTSKPLN